MTTRSIDPIIHHLACSYHPPHQDLYHSRPPQHSNSNSLRLETNNILTVVRRSLTKERKATVTLISFARSSQGKGVDLHTVSCTFTPPKFFSFSFLVFFSFSRLRFSSICIRARGKATPLPRGVLPLSQRKQRFELALSHFFTITTKNLIAIKDGVPCTFGRSWNGIKGKGEHWEERGDQHEQKFWRPIAFTERICLSWEKRKGKGKRGNVGKGGGMPKGIGVMMLYHTKTDTHTLTDTQPLHRRSVSRFF